MSTIAPNLLNRTQGQFPISIATSLALEGLFGVHEDRPLPQGQPAPITKYGSIYINVRTLIRNVFGSIPSKEAYMAIPSHLSTIVFDEMQTIYTLCTEKGPTGFECHYYLPSYHDFPQMFPNANFRETATQKQQMYATIEQQTAALLLKHFKDNDLKVETPRLKLEGGSGNALMLSHFPIDILVSKHRRFDMLESHTGLIKLKSQLTNKLKLHKKEYPAVPFDIAMLQVFGDTADMFKPCDKKIIQTLLKISEKFNWTPESTKDRVLQTTKMASEPHLYDYLKLLYKNPVI